MMRVLAILLLLAAPDDAQQLKVNRVLVDFRTMAAAIEAYGEEHQGYPRAKSMAELKAALDPQYVQGMRTADPWGTDYR